MTPFSPLIKNLYEQKNGGRDVIVAGGNLNRVQNIRSQRSLALLQQFSPQNRDKLQEFQEMSGKPMGLPLNYYTNQHSKKDIE